MSLWSPLSPEALNDPFPMYRQLREEKPVYKSQTGEWIISEYNDVQRILKDKSFISGSRRDWLERSANYLINKDIDISYIAKAIDKFILQINPPEHTRIRNFINQVWEDRDVEDIIRENAKQLITKLNSRKEFDLEGEYAQQLPAMTISKILGIPVKDHEYLQRLGTDMAKTLDLYLSLKDLLSINQSAKEFIEYFEKHIENLNTNENDGLLSKFFVQGMEKGVQLSQNELISIAIFLFVAGEETTASLISTGTYHLIRHDKFKLLSETQMDQVVEELLRYDGPVHLLGRISTGRMKIQDEIIKDGDTVTLCLAGANRDPKKFENPDELQLSRNPRHLAFGSGIHFCLGDWLARKQGKIGIEVLSESFKALSLSNQTPVRNKNLAVRGFSSLTVQKG